MPHSLQIGQTYDWCVITELLSSAAASASGCATERQFNKALYVVVAHWDANRARRTTTYRPRCPEAAASLRIGAPVLWFTSRCDAEADGHDDDERPRRVELMAVFRYDGAADLEEDNESRHRTTSMDKTDMRMHMTVMYMSRGHAVRSEWLRGLLQANTAKELEFAWKLFPADEGSPTDSEHSTGRRRRRRSAKFRLPPPRLGGSRSSSTRGQHEPASSSDDEEDDEPCGEEDQRAPGQPRRRRASVVSASLLHQRRRRRASHHTLLRRPYLPLWPGGLPLITASGLPWTLLGPHLTSAPAAPQQSVVAPPPPARPPPPPPPSPYPNTTTVVDVQPYFVYPPPTAVPAAQPQSPVGISEHTMSAIMRLLQGIEAQNAAQRQLLHDLPTLLRVGDTLRLAQAADTLHRQEIDALGHVRQDVHSLLALLRAQRPAGSPIFQPSGGIAQPYAGAGGQQGAGGGGGPGPSAALGGGGGGAPAGPDVGGGAIIPLGGAGVGGPALGGGGSGAGGGGGGSGAGGGGNGSGAGGGGGSGLGGGGVLPPGSALAPLHPEDSLEAIGYRTPDDILARAMNSTSDLECPQSSPVNCAIRNPHFGAQPGAGKCVPAGREYLCFLNNPAGGYANLVRNVTGGRQPAAGAPRYQWCVTNQGRPPSRADRDPAGLCVRDAHNATGDVISAARLDLLPWVPAPASLLADRVPNPVAANPPGSVPSQLLSDYYPPNLLSWTEAYNRQFAINPDTGARQVARPG